MHLISVGFSTAPSRVIAVPMSEVVVVALAVDVAAVAVAVAIRVVTTLVDLAYAILLADGGMVEAVDVELNAEGTAEGRSARAAVLLIKLEHKLKYNYKN